MLSLTPLTQADFPALSKYEHEQWRSWVFRHRLGWGGSNNNGDRDRNYELKKPKKKDIVLNNNNFLLVTIYSHVASSTLDVTGNQLVSKAEQLM